MDSRDREAIDMEVSKIVAIELELKTIPGRIRDGLNGRDLEDKLLSLALAIHNTADNLKGLSRPEDQHANAAA